ncbi:hypothetical protein [Enterobacter hormaechei]|uniref:hypothetical protein n=1 Tax=Enterobacter hormaechei TaxID=158836 RepID=UPI002020C5DD|nr:hypothetical protein [Enterobacter hormaechei]MCL8077206.1 hypothetical protein [Enterobacter hormaechei]MCM6986709.1 hypothetical protein [Enterobacter hormaechei]MCM7056801.1 hypothetical protein [Enterobacter hormaechei]
MDESRKAFEQACRDGLINGGLAKFDNGLYASELTQSVFNGWQAGREEIGKGSIVAYQDHYGNAISAGDFDGGEDEMHLTAFNEGWTPLVCAAGIKVKE